MPQSEGKRRRDERRASLLADITDLLRAGEFINEIARMLDMPASTLRGLIRRHDLISPVRAERDRHLTERRAGMYDA